ncbi:uncharacterized protein [Rutidosis leptorrhynchoides]|uniref:uncharacterized protein n=1 Tax=Rutidosis leptorrhynchoides TaxID=125765 RepID=UPI003A991AA4
MLENQPNAPVKQRVSMSTASNKIHFHWNWMRTPSRRTADELTSLVQLLSSDSKLVDQEDTWSWNMAQNGRFTVNMLSKIIDLQLLSPFASQQLTFFNRLAPKKVVVFIWRVQKNRIPVKVELDKRGIDLHSVLFPKCDDDLESMLHALVLCKDVFDIWIRVFKWCGLGAPTSLDLNNLVSDNDVSSFSSDGRVIWQALKWISLYLIWKNRNLLVFQGKAWNAPMVLSEIQAKAFEWISTRHTKKKFEWLSWFTNPSIYLK